jgi:nitroreductase
MAKNGEFLSETLPTKYEEAAIQTNFEEFKKVVESRRSVRVFTDDQIPDGDVEKALDMALLAPTSSNLQPWQFYWVIDSKKKEMLIQACLSQQAAKTASALIVCVAKPSVWKEHSKQMLKVINSKGEAPAMMKKYYGQITPFVYRQGIFSSFGLIKRILCFVLGFFRPVPRYPMSKSQLREWAVKSTALGCENLMLAFRALGYDSCPMEGFDEVRVKKALGLDCGQHVVMVIGAGKRSQFGVYGPQIRFPKSQFVFKV